jgi:uncharacterized SAM-binding protein YcdF (DUF218 family)
MKRWSARRRRVYVAGCLALALLVVAIAGVSRLFVWPALGTPAHADAIVMFDGVGARLSLAMPLANDQKANVLVVSQGRDGYGGPCPASLKVRVICFDPNPSDTRGEAEFAAGLAKHYRWHSLILVTGHAQATRARLLMRRCFSGRIYVVAPRLKLSDLPMQLTYESVALAKALVLRRSC